MKKKPISKPPEKPAKPKRVRHAVCLDCETEAGRKTGPVVGQFKFRYCDAHWELRKDSGAKREFEAKTRKG
jgi:hypothetical protein